MNDMRETALTGASIEVDPEWPYYQNRSVESIAEEIDLAGYKTVHYVVVNENKVSGALIDAFHERGIAVWLLVFANGSYSVDRFPEGWESWQMELVQPSKVQGFTFLSLFSEPYRQWKKEALAGIVTQYPVDGIEIIESFFPEWGGLESGVYGDIGLNAQKAFQKMYSTSLPNFTDPNAANYYLTDTDLYKKWIEFRVNGVNEFLNEIFNGAGGIREARPDIRIATWSLAVDAGQDSVLKLRELQGLDAAAMVSRVQPDIHYFQTHWPDWQKPESILPADYMKSYLPFLNQLRESHPDLPIGLQVDNGSLPSMIKSAKW